MRTIILLLGMLPAVLFAVPTVVATFDAPDNDITGLAYADGKLYAVDKTAKKIYVLNPSSGSVETSWSIDVKDADGLAYAGELLYVTNGTSDVYKFKLSGTDDGKSTLYCSG